MALTVQLTSDVVTGEAYDMEANGDEFLLAAGATYGSSNTFFFGTSATNIDIALLGHGFSATRGLVFNASAVGAYVYIGPDGSFTSFENLTGLTAVSFNSGGGTFVNDGTLTSVRGGGVSSFGDADLTNNGTITSALPVPLRNGTSSLINTGTISATDTATSSGTFVGQGVYLDDGLYTVTNLAEGVITTAVAEKAGVFVDDLSGGTRIDNYGQIVSHNGVGIDASELDAGNGGGYWWPTLA